MLLNLSWNKYRLATYRSVICSKLSLHAESCLGLPFLTQGGYSINESAVPSSNNFPLVIAVTKSNALMNRKTIFVNHVTSDALVNMKESGCCALDTETSCLRICVQNWTRFVNLLMCLRIMSLSWMGIGGNNFYIQISAPGEAEWSTLRFGRFTPFEWAGWAPGPMTSHKCCWYCLSNHCCCRSVVKNTKNPTMITTRKELKKECIKLSVSVGLGYAAQRLKERLLKYTEHWTDRMPEWKGTVKNTMS
jgi:hypothetical protein